MTNKQGSSSKAEAKAEAIVKLSTILGECAKYTRHDHRCTECRGWLSSNNGHPGLWVHDGFEAAESTGCARLFSPAPTFTHQPKVWTNVTHVSSSGMQRRIRFYVVIPDDGDLFDISYLVSRVTDWPMDDRGVKVDGCGMDMCFHTLDVVARTIKLEGVVDGNDFSIRSL